MARGGRGGGRGGGGRGRGGGGRGRGGGGRGRGGRGNPGAMGGGRDGRGGKGAPMGRADGNMGYRREDFEDEIDEFAKGRDKVGLNAEEDSEISGSEEEDEAVFDVKGAESDDESEDDVSLMLSLLWVSAFEGGWGRLMWMNWFEGEGLVQEYACDLP